MTDEPTTVSEEVLEKANRLVLEGRLTVFRRVGDEVDAVCVGDTGTRRLVSRKGITTCSCPASARTVCSHMLALALVTGNPPKEEAT